MERPEAKDNPSPEPIRPSKRDIHALKHDHRDLIRVLILDPWFRIVLVLAILGFLTAVVALPKFWRTTPPEFQPQVKVSLLNLVQAWQLRHSARAQEAGGQLEEAAETWTAAFRKNVADLETAREALRSTLALPELTPRIIQRVATLPGWLLRLSQTNQQDLLLVARFLDKSGNSEEVFGLLEPLKNRLSSEEEVAYLKALIHRGAYQEYAARWPRAEIQLAKDPEFALHHSAYLAIWGPLEGRPVARQHLVEAVEDPQLRVTALRLRLMDLAQASDVPVFEQTFARLVDARGDRLEDHLRYWSLLTTVGRKEEVRALVEQRAAVPHSPRDIVSLAEVYEALNMIPQAARLLRQATLNYGGSGASWTQALWLARANLLTRAKDWEGLVALVDELRSFLSAVQLMGGWVDAVEGIAHHGLGHREQAAVELAEAAGKPYPNPLLALEVGAEMKRLGYLQPALGVLLPLEETMQTNVVYWETVYTLAEAMKQDPVLFLKAATQVRKLKPKDPVARFNYAAALLVSRQDPSEALVLTSEGLKLTRGSPEAKVNYCMALALNQRFQEAEALLATVDPNRFDDYGKSVFYSCAFEIHLGLGHDEAARLALDKIRPQDLFPNETRRLEQMRLERLNPPAKEPPTPAPTESS